MHWRFVIRGHMFLLSLVDTYQLCSVSPKAGRSTYTALEPTVGKPSQLKAGAGGRRRLNGGSLGVLKRSGCPCTPVGVSPKGGVVD
jgi:hypothetical protein